MPLPEADKYQMKGGITSGDPFLDTRFVGSDPRRVALIVTNRGGAKPEFIYPSTLGSNSGRWCIPQRTTESLLYKNVGTAVGDAWYVLADGMPNNLNWIEILYLG